MTDTRSRIPIVIITDEGYVLPTLVAITSIVENKADETFLDFFIVTPGLSENSSLSFSIFKSDSVHISFIHEPIDEFKAMHKNPDAKFGGSTHADLIKFRLPYLINEYDKLLYLDGDIIVKEDLSTLYAYDVKDYYVAAVIDTCVLNSDNKHTYSHCVENYFNAGIMLMNLEKMRKDKISEKLIAKKKEINDPQLFLQSTLNLVFDGKVRPLPLRFNVYYDGLIRIKSKYTIDQLNEKYDARYTSIQDIASDAAIIHYCAKKKPWFAADLSLSSEWYDYFLRLKHRYPEAVLFDTAYPNRIEARSANTTKVSVIIPVFNMENYIDESIKSIMNQTLHDIQIICVNDGSEDSTPELLNSYAEDDKRIKIINQPNLGLSAARNTGLAEASGEYVYFFDSDDLLQENALEVLYDHAQKADLHMVLFDGRVFYDNEELEIAFSKYKGSYQRSMDYTGIYSGDELFTQMVQNGDYFVQACLAFYQRQYLTENNLQYRRGILHEDNLFSLQAMLLCKRAGYIHQEFFLRRIREDSIMTKTFTYTNFQGYYISFVEMLLFIIEHHREITDHSIMAAMNRLLHINDMTYRQYMSLPPDKRQEPQFF